MQDASRAADRIATLDPVADCREIACHLMTREFAWDIERALEFALFRTYALPSISGLLARTGEFERRPQKRYDDTEIILSEIVETGFDAERGRAALARMNEMHGRYRIGNEDMLYVLSTFVVEPIRWVARHGHRPMTEHEKIAWFHYHRELGLRMGIRDIPGDRRTLEDLSRRIERRRFYPADTNARIGAVTRDLLISHYLPRTLVPLGRPVTHAFMDGPLLDAMGFDPAPRWVRRGVMAAMRIRRTVLRVLPPRRRPRLGTAARRRTYPCGYRIAELGTFRDEAEPR